MSFSLDDAESLGWRIVHKAESAVRAEKVLPGERRIEEAGESVAHLLRKIESYEQRLTRHGVSQPGISAK